MNGCIADQHCKRRNDFKIDKRLDAEAPDFFQVGVAGDANYERTEEEWGDDEADQAEEDRAEELQVCGE